MFCCGFFYRWEGLYWMGWWEGLYWLGLSACNLVVWEGGFVLNELMGRSLLDGLFGGSVLDGLLGGSVLDGLVGGSTRYVGGNVCTG